jgi:hypothetical protein
MPDLDLREVYLERLGDALSLPDAERRAAIEEIDSHVELAADEMVARGTPRNAAIRQILERLGAPDRLARDITAAHRGPRDLVTAAGVAVRVTAATAFKAFVLSWAAVAMLAIAFGLAVAGLRRLLGSEFLQSDWSPLLDGLLPAAVGAVVAYAVGRSLVNPIAIAAHRSRTVVRWPVLVAGVAVATTIGLAGVEAEWSAPTAIAMASLPVWFALGVLRPAALPSIDLPGRGVAAVAVAVLVVVPLLLLGVGGQVTSFSSEGAPFDPNEAYAAVGPFVDIENPPLEILESSESAGPFAGAGPILIERSGAFVGSAAGEWTDLRLEVWQGPADELNGAALDPAATEPLVTAPMIVSGSRVHGSVELLPEPRRSFYYVAITGVAADGERVQLAWPGVEWWQWRGTALQFFEALIR